MYVSKHHQMPDPADALALINAHPLGAWVVQTSAGLCANHVPFVWRPEEGDQDVLRGPVGRGVLVGHVSRANSVWRGLLPGTPSVVMFQGPQAYITPRWYPGKKAHGKVVPTWNYAVAHVHGVARAIEDPAWILGVLHALTDAQEAASTAPWRVDDAPPAYIDALVRGVVGIEIAVERIEAKCKASQDEAREDRLGTVDGLRERGDDQDVEMAARVSRALG